MAAAGATVTVLACSPEQASSAIDHVLMDPVSIDTFAQRFLASGKSLDILINNAVIMAPPLVRNLWGYKSQFAVNPLGHFQLTLRLWPASKRVGAARVVSFSSLEIRFGGVNFSDPNFKV